MNVLVTSDFNDVWRMVNVGTIEVLDNQFVVRNSASVRFFTSEESVTFSTLRRAGLVTVPNEDYLKTSRSFVW